MGDCSDGDDDDNVEEEEEDDDDDNNHNNDDDNSDDDDDCDWGEGGDFEGDVCQIEEWLENLYFYSVFFN